MFQHDCKDIVVFPPDIKWEMIHVKTLPDHKAHKCLLSCLRSDVQLFEESSDGPISKY